MSGRDEVSGGGSGVERVREGGVEEGRSGGREEGVEEGRSGGRRSGGRRKVDKIHLTFNVLLCSR